MKARVLCFALVALVAVSAVYGQLPSPSPVPASPQVTGDCVIYTNNTLNGTEFKLDGPSRKACSKCQWQCLTDFNCTRMTYNGDSFNRTSLPTLNCAAYSDPWFTSPSSPGICVMFNATGAVIDTQEQSCAECVHQCQFWSDCTGFLHNYLPTCPVPAGRRLA